MNFSTPHFPPENFEQLRLLTLQINRGDIKLTMGKRSLKALNYMTNHPEQVAQHNIVELAALTQLSAASITRLSKLLGFRGFAAFHKVFKQKSNTTEHFYSHSLQKLQAKKSLSTQNILQQQAEKLQHTLLNTIKNINEKALEQAKLLLANKHRIFIFGARQSSTLASMLRYGLALIRPNVQMLMQAEHGVALALGQLRQGDLLVLIGSSPYSNETIKIAQQAQQNNCQILVITDGGLSPLQNFSALSLHIPSTGEFYANSLVINCFIIENLLTLTALALGNTAVENLQKHERLLAEFSVSG